MPDFKKEQSRSSPSCGAGVTVSLARGRYGLRYAALSDNNFIDALRSKLLWGEDRRNTNRNN